MTSPQLATIRQVMEQRPYVTERWLRRLRAERRVTTFSAGGRVLFDLNDLDRYIESTRQDAVS
jgi:hypothetical protein